MADENKTEVKTEVKEIKCAQTGVKLKKIKRYYREGLYFINKAAYKAYKTKKREEGTLEKDQEKKPASPKPEEEPKPKKVPPVDSQPKAS